MYYNSNNEASGQLESQQYYDQQRMNELMIKYYMTALENQMEEKRKRKEEEEQANQPWYFKWKSLFFGSSTATAVIAYLIWSHSFQPIADMRKTFSGIRYFTTDPAMESRVEEDKQRLKDELSKLEPKRLLILCAPEKSGKSTLLESVLSDSMSYEVCHVKLKGASSGDYLMQRLRTSFGLEESALEAAVRRILAIGDFGRRSEVKQKNLFIDIATEVERRLDINILNILNRQRVILVDEVGHMAYSLEGGPNNPELLAIKELFAWLAQLENCSVVLISTDGFIEKVIHEAGLTERAKFIALNDMNYSQSKSFFTRLVKLYNQKNELNFDDVFRLVGGRTFLLNKIAQRPKKERIQELEVSTRKWVKNAAKGNLGKPVDITPPLTRLVVFNKLLEKAEMDLLKQQTISTDEEARLLEKFNTIGDGNGQGSSGVGVYIEDLIDLGVSKYDIEKMSRANLVFYNPTNSRVSLPNRLYYNTFKNNRDIWEPECHVTIGVSNEESHRSDITLQSADFNELVKKIKKKFNIPTQKNIEVYIGKELITSDRQLLNLMPGQEDINFKIQQ